MNDIDIDKELETLKIKERHPKFFELLNKYPNHSSLYGKIDSLFSEFGIGMVLEDIYKSDGETFLGYRPYIKYYPKNILNENPRLQLIYDSSNLYLERGAAYRDLIKAILYKFDYQLIEIIKNQQ